MTTTTQNDSAVVSADGTSIAYSRRGSGPALIIVHCVSCDRVTTPQPGLPAALAEHFTVISYDRRGTGQSMTDRPYAVEREYEDLAALTALVPGPVDVYGFSSGAVLALRAAQAAVPIRRLALLEPPLVASDLAAERRQISELLPADPAGARLAYMRDLVGVPPEILAAMPPTDRDLANAPSMLHELEFLAGTTAERFRGLATPALLMRSDHTVPEMGVWAQQLTAVMPHARAVELPGTWHGVDDATLATAMHGFLLDGAKA